MVAVAAKPRQSAGEQAVLLPYQRRVMLDRSRYRMWLGSRRIGKDFLMAADCALPRLAGQNTRDALYVSKDEESTRVFVGYVKRFATNFGKAVKVLERTNHEVVQGKDLKVFEVQFPDVGKRRCNLYAFSSNPESVRGFGGDAYVSEHARHKQAETLWEALAPCIMRGGRVTVASSAPDDEQHFFWGLVQMALRNTDPEQHGAPRAYDVPFTFQKTTILDAIEDGLVENINDVEGTSFTREEFLDDCRAQCTSEEMWLREYMCVPGRGSGSYFPNDLLRTIVHRDDPMPTGDVHTWLANIRRVCMPEEKGGLGAERLYAGCDVGRTDNRFVICVGAKLGGMNRTAGDLVLQGAPFSEMKFALWTLMKLREEIGRRSCSVRRLAIDATGIGYQLGEELEGAFRARAEAVRFTPEVKEDLATRARVGAEERTYTIPDDRETLADFHAIRQERTAAGNARFVSTANESGHQDRFWAKALMLMAAESRSEVRAVEVERGAWM